MTEAYRSGSTHAELAAARQQFAEKFGRPIFWPSIEDPKVFYYESGFSASEEVLERLRQLSDDPELARQYPNHRVFVTPTGEVIGATPTNLLTYTGWVTAALARNIYEKLNTELQTQTAQRGITLSNCAIIHTGPPERLFCLVD